MFLGINYNKWHAIIAILGFQIGFFILWLLLPFTEPVRFIIAWPATVLVLYFIHDWNEDRQASEPRVTIIKKYGSIENFRLNSLDDWKWFWRGILSAPFLSALIIVCYELLS